MKGRLLRLAGAPLLWAAHFTALYALASLACSHLRPQALAPGLAILGGSAVLTAAALALAIAGVLRNRGARRDGAPGAPDTFIARTAMLLYGLAAIGMAWVALPVFLLPSCT